MAENPKQRQTVPKLSVLNTERLLLRAWTLEDAPAVDKAFADEDVVKMTGSKPYPYLPNTAFGSIAARTGKYLRGEMFDFAITDKTTNELVGGVGVFKRQSKSPYELGYWLAKPHWGKGYATEAAKKLMEWATQTLNADMIVAGHFEDNPASGRILYKLGFEQVGGPKETIPMYSLARGGRFPGYVYIWPAEKAATTPLSALH